MILKKRWKLWAVRLAATLILIAAILFIIILNPVITYAHHAKHRNYAIYFSNSLDPALTAKLDEATRLLQQSEFYQPDLKLDICLNDGAIYPEILKIFRGRAFAWGFYNKVVLQGHADYQNNYVELDGYKWNLQQLLTHELVHCMQFNKLGFWNSAPIADIPGWKWEGYAEYIARKDPPEKDLYTSITRFLETEKTKHNGWIQFTDGTGTVLNYYQGWLLVKFCMEIKKMKYTQILADSSSEEMIQKEMLAWYSNND